MGGRRRVDGRRHRPHVSRDRTGSRRGNPIARFALERVGYVALGAFKLFALGVGLAGRAALPAEYTAIVPLGLAVPWTIASLINVALIVTVS